MSLQASQRHVCASTASALGKITISEEHPFGELEKSSSRQPGHEDEPEITYPEGGRAAWIVVVGSWCAMTAGLGLVNSVGVFQAYVSTNLLPSYSASAIGWIFGIYVFVSYFCGLQVGPIFDAKGPFVLLMVGSICLLIGIFTLSVCTGMFAFLPSISYTLRSIKWIYKERTRQMSTNRPQNTTSLSCPSPFSLVWVPLSSSAPPWVPLPIGLTQGVARRAASHL